MVKFFLKYLLVGVLFLPLACIRSVNVPIRNVSPNLVVEGSITTSPPPYTIKLSYSGAFDATYQLTPENYISDAQVVIEDDLGDSTSCQWQYNGTYLSTDSNFIGKVGRAYTLKIRLSNGKTYVSNQEKITPVPSIDSVTITYDSSYISDVRPTQFIISVNTHDPAGAQNYYRWTASAYVPRKSYGWPCSISSPPCGIYCTCFALCVQYTPNNAINVMSDQFVDGREIQQPVYYSPVYWFGTHFIEMEQYSINKDVYIFWNQYLAQTNRTGSILDPLPAPLLGNVHNQADSNDVALGIFSASDVVSKKIKITPFFLQEYYLLSIAIDFIKMGDCHSVYVNSLDDDASPPGWDSAQSFEFH
ncbi:MAG TPA: DUF4249 domain-containing protein [Puia sp.]|nr:DUF4249 domain-containing protein [Puia sp.]